MASLGYKISTLHGTLTAIRVCKASNLVTQTKGEEMTTTKLIYDRSEILYPPSRNLISADEHNRRRKMATLDHPQTGVECPLCHQELISTYRRSEVTCSIPPQIGVKCENCSYHGFILA